MARGTAVLSEERWVGLGGPRPLELVVGHLGLQGATKTIGLQSVVIAGGTERWVALGEPLEVTYVALP